MKRWITALTALCCAIVLAMGRPGRAAGYTVERVTDAGGTWHTDIYWRQVPVWRLEVNVGSPEVAVDGSSSRKQGYCLDISTHLGTSGYQGSAWNSYQGPIGNPASDGCGVFSRPHDVSTTLTETMREDIALYSYFGRGYQGDGSYPRMYAAQALIYQEAGWAFSDPRQPWRGHDVSDLMSEIRRLADAWKTASYPLTLYNGKEEIIWQGTLTEGADPLDLGTLANGEPYILRDAPIDGIHPLSFYTVSGDGVTLTDGNGSDGILVFMMTGAPQASLTLTTADANPLTMEQPLLLKAEGKQDLIVAGRPLQRQAVLTMDLLRVPVRVVKRSASEEITAGNPAYSLAGAQFTVMAGGKVLGTLTTDEDGAAEGWFDPPSDFRGITVQETAASPGYRVDPQPHPAQNHEGRYEAEVREPPLTAPADLVLTKISEDGRPGPSLAGAQFTVGYYPGRYDSADQLPAAPQRRWVLATREEPDGSCRAVFDADHLVSGDPFFTDPETGRVCFPLGTLAVRETRAPQGYTREGGWLNSDGAAVEADEVLLIPLNGDDGRLRWMAAGNRYTKQERPLRILVAKVDEQGAYLAGAGLEIIRLNADGSPGDVVWQGRSADQPLDVSAALVQGARYRLRETAAPAGYQIAPAVEFTAAGTARQPQTVRMTDERQRWSVAVQKTDAESGQPLSGAQLALVDEEGNVVADVSGAPCRGVSRAEGPLVWEVFWQPEARWYVVEEAAPEGYLRNAEKIPVSPGEEPVGITVADHPIPPATGDPRDRPGHEALLGGSLLTAGWLAFLENRRRKKR